MSKFNLIHEKEWSGDTIIFVRGMFPGRRTISGRADTRRKESKDYQSSLEDLPISSTRK